MLSDDHRYDFMSLVEGAPGFLETPNFDRMAEQGAHLKNAFVTTSLCSPSRASILTGQFMHRHRVVDNQRAVPEGTEFFPQLLQAAGYQTAFIGKWHMGHDDDTPRNGFDHWVSFKGQGVYFDPELNINGARKTIKGYTTDVLTAEALRWLNEIRDPSKPFLLYLSFKAVPLPIHSGTTARRTLPGQGHRLPRNDGVDRRKLRNPATLGARAALRHSWHRSHADGCIRQRSGAKF